MSWVWIICSHLSGGVLGWPGATVPRGTPTACGRLVRGTSAKFQSVLHCKLHRIQASEWVRVNKVLQGSCKSLYCMWRRCRAPRDAGDCMICVGDKLQVWRGGKNMTGRFWPEMCGLWWIKNTRQTLGRDLSPPAQLRMHDVWAKNDSNRWTVMKWTSKPKIHPSVSYHLSAQTGSTGWCMTPVKNVKA